MRTARTVLAAATIAICFVSSNAMAQERLGDAALGALSGALVLGPVGTLAGAAVGYTAGPSIARSWGLKGKRHSGQARARNRKASAPTNRTRAARPATAGSMRAAAGAAPSLKKSANALPPAQDLD